MKKKISMIGLLLLILSSYAQTTVGGENIRNTDCVSFSIDVYDAVLTEGGTDANGYTGMVAAYNFCVSNGGHPGDSIIDLSD